MTLLKGLCYSFVVITVQSWSNFIDTLDYIESAACIKGLFWSPMRLKCKIVFHQFILVSLLEQ